LKNGISGLGVRAYGSANGRLVGAQLNFNSVCRQHLGNQIPGENCCVPFALKTRGKHSAHMSGYQMGCVETTSKNTGSHSRMIKMPIQVYVSPISLVRKFHPCEEVWISEKVIRGIFCGTPEWGCSFALISHRRTRVKAIEVKDKNLLER